MFRVYFLFVTPCTFSHGIIISSFKLRKIRNAFLVYLNTTFNNEDMRTIIMQNRCRLTIFNYSSSMLIEKIISFICFFESLCFVYLQNQWILKYRPLNVFQLLKKKPDQNVKNWPESFVMSIETGWAVDA